MSSNKDFGEWLKSRREEAGYSTAYRFAEKVGFDKTYVGRIEKGDRPPTASFCVAIAPVLGFTKDYVLNLAGLTEEQPDAPKDFTDVEETYTILKTFPNTETKRRAIRLANNLLRELAQDARESIGQVERNANDPTRKTARRNVAT